MTIDTTFLRRYAAESAVPTGDWIECPLSSACRAIDYGLTASASLQPDGPRFLRITDIVSGHVDWNTVPYVALESAQIEKYRLRDGDIVLARTGASTGASAYVKSPPDAVFASYLVRLRASPDFDARFLAYYLKSPRFYTYMSGVLGDKSAQPNASASTMGAAPLRAPIDLGEQRAIADILGALDDKIELNRRMNETLDAMTRTLFRSWFVDFEPVRAKMEGRDTRLPESIANLFPTDLVRVGRQDTAIPIGWSAVPLNEIAEFLNGLALQKYPMVDAENSLPVIKIAELRNGVTAKTTRASNAVPAKYVIKDGDFLFSWSGSLMAKFWTGGPGALNQHLFKVTSSDYPRWFFAQSVQHHLPTFQKVAAGKATTMGHIQRHHLAEAMTVCPPADVLRELDTIMSSLLRRSITTQVESRMIARIRDELLPKLISGELRVSDTERIAAAVI